MDNFSAPSLNGLDALTDRQVSLSIPVLCFISIFVLIGTVGNALVIFTYFTRVDKSSTNLFIFSLAVFDIISCCLGLPITIYKLLNPYTNDQNYLCAIHSFIGFTADISSGYIIVCISFDRYLRIARPHQGLSIKTSKLAVGIVCIFATLFSSFTLFVFGTETVTFDEYPEITGNKCGTADHAKDTVVPLLFNTLVLVCFGIGVVILFIVYTLLGIKVNKWNKERKNKQTKCRRSEMYFQAMVVSDDTESRESQTDNSSPRLTGTFFVWPKADTLAEVDATKEEATFNKPSYVRELSRSLDRNHFLKLDGVHANGTKTLPLRKSESFKQRQAANLGRKSSMPSFTGIRKRMKLSRTTIMFMFATIAFVASHLPYACVKIAMTVNRDLIKSMSDVAYSFFLFAEYSFIVSYGINPLIYSFLNQKFRRECKSLLLEVSRTIKCKSKQFYV